jgi:cell division protein FtsL
MKNNTSKYFKYAIGEIALVVVGILIALQINNWNEQRKTEKTNTILLQQLLEENKLNLSQLELDKPHRDSLHIKMSQFIDFLKEDIENEEVRLKSYLAELFRSTSYTFSENYLVSYINSNKSENSAITKEVAELHSNQKDLAFISQKAMDIRFENFYNVLIKNIDFQNLDIISYQMLKSLEFKNKVTMMSIMEKEVNVQFDRTLQQHQKVDSIINTFIKRP